MFKLILKLIVILIIIAVLSIIYAGLQETRASLAYNFVNENANTSNIISSYFNVPVYNINSLTHSLQESNSEEVCMNLTNSKNTQTYCSSTFASDFVYAKNHQKANTSYSFSSNFSISYAINPKFSNNFVLASSSNIIAEIDEYIANSEYSGLQANTTILKNDSNVELVFVQNGTKKNANFISIVSYNMTVYENDSIVHYNFTTLAKNVIKSNATKIKLVALVYNKTIFEMS